MKEKNMWKELLNRAGWILVFLLAVLLYQVPLVVTSILTLKEVALLQSGLMVAGLSIVVLALFIMGARKTKLASFNFSFFRAGLDFIKDHPEARAEDLIHAFSDDSIDMILCAIGGDDTYRLLPYLFENDQLQKVIKQKIFLLTAILEKPSDTYLDADKISMSVYQRQGAIYAREGM
ncbi:LD-carboxypeptidase [Burkholderia cenocepacia]|nr:LD-carboxypeptidase [Burkholderia cenocepacia]